MYLIRFRKNAFEELQELKKNDQQVVISAIESRLSAEPLTETRNRKMLRPNDLGSWELRVDRFRVFYDVDVKSRVVTVTAVGWKDHNTLYIRGREYPL